MDHTDTPAGPRSGGKRPGPARPGVARGTSQRAPARHAGYPTAPSLRRAGYPTERPATTLAGPARNFLRRPDRRSAPRCPRVEKAGTPRR